MHKWVYDIFMEKVTLEDNEKTFTSPDCTYRTWDGHFAIRYVYQVKLDDGTIEEYDMECEFLAGGPLEKEKGLYFISDEVLGEKRVIKP